MTGPCKICKQALRPYKAGKFLNSLAYHYFVRKDSAIWSYTERRGWEVITPAS
jgi:hypothetical protein